MDWTGGTRRRYAGKGKGNAVVQKQKAHFAKARAAAGYHVIPETYRQEAAASREHQPQMVAAQTNFEHVRGCQLRGTSRGSGAPLVRHQRGSIQNTNRIAHKMTRSKPPGRMRAKPNAAATDHELALVTNRERLLARQDWLGLAPTQPVRFNFPSNAENERIGKRRKVDKPKAHKIQREEPSLVDVPFVPAMSGAIGLDDIQIKVGTDALLSQTQRSRHSQHSANTSVRPVSTDFGPISEESMLLKADSDGFETQEADGTVRVDQFDDVEAELPRKTQDRQEVNGQYGYESHSGFYRQDRLMNRSANSASFEGERPGFSDGLVNEAARYSTVEISRPSQAMSGDVEDHWNMADSDFDLAASMHRHAWPDYIGQIDCAEREDMLEPTLLMNTERTHLDSRAVGQHLAAGEPYPSQESSPAETPDAKRRNPRRRMSRQWSNIDGEAPPPRSGRSDEENDESAWKRFMNIKQAASSDVSVAALRSSSAHMTQSTTSAWPVALAAENEVEDSILDDQENLDSHFLEAEFIDDPPGITAQSSFASTAISSPSPSHGQILQLVNQAPTSQVAHEAGAQDEQLWRAFVIGSQSSQSQSSHNGRRWVRTVDSDALLPVQSTPVQFANEQPRSDRMTTGGSVYATHDALTTDSQEELSSQSRTRTNTSLVGHATTFNPETDGVEESEMALRRERKPANIHAIVDPQTRLSRRYFEPRKRTKYAPVPRTFPRALTKSTMLAAPKSIYDLSTSDG